MYIIQLETFSSMAIKSLIETLKYIVSDINLTFNSNGLILKEISKISKILIHCKLYGNKFDKYIYNYSKPKITIGINLDTLLMVLKCVSNLDKMTWALDNDDTNKLIIIIENSIKKEKKIFKINLLDINDSNVNIDPIDFPFLIKMDSSDLSKYCKDMLTISDNMEIICSYNKVSFNSVNADVGDVKFEVYESNDRLSIEVSSDNKEEITKGTYSLRWLTIFMKCSNLTPYVYLYIKDGKPLIIKYHIDLLGEVKFVLSPL